MSLYLLASTSNACPSIAGKWSCFEKSFDYRYQENFEIENLDGVLTYRQTLKDEGQELTTYDKVTDNIVRLVSHLAIADHDYYFYQNTTCTDSQTLQTHEVVERRQKSLLIAKSSAEFILKLEDDDTLRMITHSKDENGVVYENDFVGVCTRL